MNRYSDLIDRIFLHADLLRELQPQEPLQRELFRTIRSAEDTILSGGRAITSPETFSLVRGGAFYALDALPESHALFQEAPGDLGSYWHGMVHRREG
ncbi:MAG: hypothetical protein V4710_08120, partial [Verrucomicrobiota bacterium]